MDTDTGTQITRQIARADGSEVRIVASIFEGIDWKNWALDVYVLRRESPQHPWAVMSNMPHPDWRLMSVQEYVEHGRPEMLRAASHAEILSVTGPLAARRVLACRPLQAPCITEADPSPSDHPRERITC